MNSYQEIAVYLNELFHFPRPEEIWWIFDLDTELKTKVILNVFYESKEAAKRFYELFGHDLPGMRMTEMKDDESLATTMIVCPAGLTINWSLCDRFDEPGCEGFAVCTNDIAQRIKQIMINNVDAIVDEVEQQYERRGQEAEEYLKEHGLVPVKVK